MNSESLVATEKMLDVVKRLLDEQEPDSLFPRILNIARVGLPRNFPDPLDVFLLRCLQKTSSKFEF